MYVQGVLEIEYRFVFVIMVWATKATTFQLKNSSVQIICLARLAIILVMMIMFYILACHTAPNINNTECI